MSNFGRAGLGTDWFNTQRSNFTREAYVKEELYINRWYEQNKAGGATSGSAYEKGGETANSLPTDTINPVLNPTIPKKADVPLDPHVPGPEEEVAAWTSYRGSFKDPCILGISKLERNFMRPKTDRGDFQEQCIKQGTTLTKNKGGAGKY